MSASSIEDWVKAKICEMLTERPAHIYYIAEQFDLSLVEIVVKVIVDLEQTTECVCYMDTGIVEFKIPFPNTIPTANHLRENVVKHLLSEERKLYWSARSNGVRQLKYNAFFDTYVKV